MRVPFFAMRFGLPQRRSTSSGSPRTLLFHHVFEGTRLLPHESGRSRKVYCTIWSPAAALLHIPIRYVLFQYMSILHKVFRQPRTISHAGKVELCAVWFASRGSHTLKHLANEAFISTTRVRTSVCKPNCTEFYLTRVRY